MTKYKEYYDKMVENNKEAFDAFTRLHFEYTTNPDRYQKKFNQEGEKIQTIIREWEGKLCRTQEKTYSQYAGGLADKFWGEIRKHYPKIDSIGIIVKDAQPKKEVAAFSLKKINLH
jgi:hypothetical protein